MLNFQLVFDKKEQCELSNTERTIFLFHSDNIWYFKGGLFSVIKNDSIVKEGYSEKFEEEVEEVPTE